jgi:hypothetical protein
VDNCPITCQQKNNFCSWGIGGVITIERVATQKDNQRIATEERVLCFERKLLEELGVFQGLSLEVGKYLPVVTSASHLVYLNRSDAEQDKRYKQLIPYVLLICKTKYCDINGAKKGRKHGCTDCIPSALGDTSQKKTTVFSQATAATRRECGAN